MPNLVGTGLNQVPTNSMLGGLAYQDPEHASIKNLDLKNLSQINSEIADTAVDVFVYDTSKDSDGGAWRKRTQNTSWYNETLNTATRGSRKEFPAVAVIVVTEDDVIIYDGDDPDLPMWMIFESSNTGTPYDTHYLGRGSGFSGFHPSITSVAMLNGILVVGKDGDSTNYAEAYTEIRFISDRALHRDQTSAADMGNAISGRNGSAGGRISNSSYGGLVHFDLHDVAMTVLPNAPVDSATGLPVPTIAVATDGGVSVIRDDGSVADIIQNSPYTQSHNVFFSDYGKILYDNEDTQVVYEVDIPSADIGYGVYNSTSNGRVIYPVGNHGGFSSGEIRLLGSNISNGGRLITKGAFAVDENGATESDYGPVGLSLFDRAESDPAKQSLVAYVASDYNTGWMHGDIKGAFLSDTDTTNVTSSNLMSGATYNNSARITSYSYTAGSDTLVIDDDEATVDGYVILALGGLSPSTKYVISYVTDNTYTPTAGYNPHIGNTSVGTSYFDSAQTGSGQGSMTFTTASSGDPTLVLYSNYSGGNLTYTINLRLAEEDRSVNNNGLAVYGTITKTPVATGADLVGYSGIDQPNGNYIEQPYNSDLDFGIGDFSIIIWTYIASGTDGDSYVIGRRTTSAEGFFSYYDYGADYLRFRTSESSTYSTIDVNSPGIRDRWACIALVRRSGTQYIYIDGEQRVSGPSTKNINSNGKFTIGWTEPFPTTARTTNKFALCRISASVPSAKQVKKMYEDEKVLFQENAKATLYGSSDAVTALAYDEVTDQLHVGTSAGRSEFQGLSRINNTTDAVTTAISASNGLVAEQ